ncbi:MAG: alkaline phosphatase [Fimbriimonadaceae bacterium]
MDISRRSLLSFGAAGLIAPNLEALLDRLPARPKNIIFCVADGMAVQVPTIVDYYQQQVLGKSSYWAWLQSQPFAHSALQETRALSSIVTDSAAASSAWGSGRRIWNGMLNMYPDRTKLDPIVGIMSAAGVRCGLVTTTTMTHATPAGFAVNNIARGNEQEIAESYLTSGVQVLLGGGNKFFDPTKRADKTDIYEKFRSAGFKVCRTRSDLSAQPGGKLLGIFSDSHVPYSIDRDHDPELQKTVPTLAQMAQVAIDSLKGGKRGFLLQIEGGKVDHAAHANDVSAMIFDQIAFEEAVKVAVDFALADKETLVIITADHATGGPSLNGDGTEYFDSTMGLSVLAGMKSSVTAVIDSLGKDSTATQVKDRFVEKLGVELSADETATVTDAITGGAPLKNMKFLNSKSGVVGAILGNHCKVTWTSGNHTCDHVQVISVGPGSELIKGVVSNYTFFDLMLGFKDLKHSNPTMSFETAHEHYKKLKLPKDGGLEHLESGI